MNLSDEASFAGTSFQPAQHAVASYARIISPKLVNELRVGFNRYRLDYTADQFAPGAALGNQLGVPNANVTPQEQNLPIFSPGQLSRHRPDPFSSHLSAAKTPIKYVDNMTCTTGKHTLKWGVDFRRRQLTIYQTNQGNGRFNFSPALTDSRNPAGTGGDSAASFLLGYPTLDPHDYTQNWPGERGYELGVVHGRRLARHQQTDSQSRACAGIISALLAKWRTAGPTSISKPPRSTSPGAMA